MIAKTCAKIAAHKSEQKIVSATFTGRDGLSSPAAFSFPSIVAVFVMFFEKNALFKKNNVSDGIKSKSPKTALVPALSQPVSSV